MKKQIFFLYAVATLFLLTGCWDKMELEDRAYVVVLGIDKSEDENYVDITFQIANPQVGSSATGDESMLEPPSDIVTITAIDVAAAKDLVNSIVTRRVSFRHLQTLVIGEDLARTEQSHHIVSSAIIEPEIRHSMSFIVSKEPAQQFINNNKPAMETRPHKYYDFMRRRWKELGFVPDANLNRYFQRQFGELFLAVYATTEKTNEEPTDEGYTSGDLPQQGGDPVQMVGSAVFKYGKMIGTITGRDTKITLALRDRSGIRSGLETFQDPINANYPISVRMFQVSNPDVKLSLHKNPIQIDVTMPVRLEVVSDLSLTNYSTNMKNQQILKESLKKQLEEKTLESIQKMQEEFKAEPYLWHLKARKKFWTLKEFEDYKWEEKFADANVTVNYEVEIANFGEQTKPAKLKRAQEKEE